jgi:hypothetical protein
MRRYSTMRDPNALLLTLTGVSNRRQKDRVFMGF